MTGASRLCRLATIAASLLLAACTNTSEGTYFDFSWIVTQTGSIAPGATAYFGLPGIDIRGGDRLQLIDIDSPTLESLHATAMFVRLKDTRDGQQTIAEETQIGPDLDLHRPLPADLTSADGAIGILVRFTMPDTER